MLKRLELVGFKSFAEKTQIEFAPGITAIVGPNGSGKSNIVDAVKWVLGEQSAKSLRGGEMADVIFNGSSSRRSLGMAEVTMTFDNSKKILDVETAEVQITRRVYRDGQGEYLINQQPSRLRDIKDLFLGSGAAHGAYGIIEQGRVDQVLQASHRDRRIIFEEAAGISRFKARKIETLRKLENVEQNLQRSNDLLAELDKQLRSVKLQAAKAQRYQEHSTRLRELRLGLGLQEYHELQQALQTETEALARLRAELEQSATRTAQDDERLRQLDTASSELEDQTHTCESRLAQIREQIASFEARRDFEAAATADLEGENSRLRARHADLSIQMAQLSRQADEAQAEWQTVADAGDQCRLALREHEASLRDVESELARLRHQVEADRAAHLERLREATRYQNDAIGLKTRLDNLRNRRANLSERTAHASESLMTLGAELQELSRAESQYQADLTASREAHGRLTEEQDGLRRRADEMRQQIADLRVRRSGLVSRIEVLEQLERGQEGLGVGVREVLDQLRLLRERGPMAGATGPDWSCVIGLVADCFTVPSDVAPLIDLALGDTAQSLLVRDVARLDEVLNQRDTAFTSRVSFIPLPGVPADPSPLLEDRCAADVVACEVPELGHLPRALLGNVYLVPDLSTARRLAATPAGSRCRFVTRQGELLDPDGRLTVGTHHAETGLLSRKSELRDLRVLTTDLDAQIAAVDLEHADLRQRIEQLEKPLYDLQQRINELVEDAGEMNARVKLQEQKRTGLQDEVSLSQGEIEELDREIGELDVCWAEARLEAEDRERAAQLLHKGVEDAVRVSHARELDRLRWSQICSQGKVELAQIDERLAAQRQRRSQIEADLGNRRREFAQFEMQEAAIQQRLCDSLLTRLEASASLADAFVLKEQAEATLADLIQNRERVRAQRREIAEHLQASQAERQERSDRAHAHELRASETRMRLDGLCTRLRDDYQIELAEVYERSTQETGAAPPAVDPNAVHTEIDDLRRKLTRLGSVNLEALDELADLEQRVADKQAQHEDLTRSQHDLREIIAKINQDSQKLFVETFSSVRSHFQDLFRRLFGGGMADVVLEDENDVLECGIDIIARPPGKELRSISLMSGGERTLTAVALLLAVFRSKPSPFCLLDEVDAALDEANNNRLAGVLREFLELSQFIVVTHKKRTMAVADVLYGITMQESGVSKQVSVRFEDWPDDEVSTGEQESEVEPTRAAG